MLAESTFPWWFRAARCMFICALRKSWWRSYKSYEVCNSFYKESQRVIIKTGEYAGKTVWDEMGARVQNEVDLTHALRRPNQSQPLEMISNVTHCHTVHHDANNILLKCKTETDTTHVTITELSLNYNNSFAVAIYVK